ncbi:hypothetical protein CMV_008301 [Castanea mollissima]|uniref:Uncharacterized protein n=1 Tax=Castanea mollissima TaxID=60419 RepID=A0A8J4RK72_9ROSI|nr:hypothetical protein CMV_008301 [Castanea mollissima]
MEPGIDEEPEIVCPGPEDPSLLTRQRNHRSEDIWNGDIYNYQGVFNEDYNIANTLAPNDVPAGTPAVVAQNDVGKDDDDEPPLNENDDDDFDDVDQVEEQNTQHLVLAQFDKVTRTKSRWKCTLKDGIMHIKNKDILFNKVTPTKTLLENAGTEMNVILLPHSFTSFDLLKESSIIKTTGTDSSSRASF